MAQLFYHKRGDPNFKKNFLLKTIKQQYIISLLSAILSISVLFNLILILKINNLI